MTGPSSVTGLRLLAIMSTPYGGHQMAGLDAPPYNEGEVYRAFEKAISRAAEDGAKAAASRATKAAALKATRAAPLKATGFNASDIKNCPEAVKLFGELLAYMNRVGTPAYLGERWEKQAGSEAARQRLRDALLAIKHDAPLVIAEEKAEFSSTSPVFPAIKNARARIEALEKILSAASRASRYFPPLANGKRLTGWHSYAAALADHALKILGALGMKRAGVGHPTSPAVMFVVELFALMDPDHPHKAEAVSKELRRSKKQNGQTL